MADQQDQSLSGGSVEKASASADTSNKIKGKGILNASGATTITSYRKRHNTNTAPVTLDEKRRRQQVICDSQSPQGTTYAQRRTVIDTLSSSSSSKNEAKAKNERRNNGLGLECLFGMQLFFLIQI